MKQRPIIPPKKKIANRVIITLRAAFLCNSIFREHYSYENSESIKYIPSEISREIG